MALYLGERKVQRETHQYVLGRKAYNILGGPRCHYHGNIRGGECGVE